MKGKTKRKFTRTGGPADFKLKVVLEVLKEKDTLALISRRHELHGTGHPAQSDQRPRRRPGGKQFMDTASTLFEAVHKPTLASAEPDVTLLYEQIGRLQMELTFFKKKLPQ